MLCPRAGATKRRRLAPIFPAREPDLVLWNGAGLRPARVGRHGGRPSTIPTNAARERPSKPWRAMLRRRPFFPRASAALSDGMRRGCAPHKSDDTEVVPPVSQRTRRVSAYRKPWRAMLRRRPFFQRASAALSDGMRRGFAPRKSDDTEVVPPRPQQPPVCQLSGSASKHGVPSDPSSFRLPLDLRKASFPNCGPDGSRGC